MTAMPKTRSPEALQLVEGIVIEPATADHAEAIWPVYVEGRLDNQPCDELGLTRKAVELYLCGHDGSKAQSGIAQWRDKIKAADETHQVFVAHDLADDTIVGVVSAESTELNGRSLNKLYVAGDRRGQGIGSLLINAVIEFHEEDRVGLRAAEYNTRGIQLYERHGFTTRRTLSGFHTYDIDGINIPQVIMVRPAGPIEHGVEQS